MTGYIVVAVAVLILFLAIRLSRVLTTANQNEKIPNSIFLSCTVEKVRIERELFTEIKKNPLSYDRQMLQLICHGFLEKDENEISDAGATRTYIKPFIEMIANETSEWLIPNLGISGNIRIRSDNQVKVECHVSRDIIDSFLTSCDSKKQIVLHLVGIPRAGVDGVYHVTSFTYECAFSGEGWLGLDSCVEEINRLTRLS